MRNSSTIVLNDAPPIQKQKRRRSLFFPWKSGKPTRLPLTSLFLLSPEVDFAFVGVSVEEALRQGFEKIGKTPVRARLLARRAAQAARKSSSSGSRAYEAMQELMNSELMPDVKHLGDSISVLKWGLTAAGCQKSGFNWRTANFYARIESDCAEAHDALIKADPQAAAARLDGLESLHPVLWPGALDGFRQEVDARHREALVTVARLSILMEIRLAGLAIQEYQVQQDGDAGSRYSLEDILPRSNVLSEGSNARFAIWLTKSAGIVPIEAILKDRRFNMLTGLTHTTVSRWKHGKQRMNPKHLLRLVKALPDDDQRWRAHHLYIAVRQINLLGHLWTHIAQMLGQWPEVLNGKVELPHGYVEIDQWIRARLPVWRERAPNL